MKYTYRALQNDMDGDLFFGTMPRTMITLVQMMTFDSWVSQAS